MWLSDQVAVPKWSHEEQGVQFNGSDLATAAQGRYESFLYMLSTGCVVNLNNNNNNHVCEAKDCCWADHSTAACSRG
jgi:hypothetical protein